MLEFLPQFADAHWSQSFPAASVLQTVSAQPKEISQGGGLVAQKVVEHRPTGPLVVQGLQPYLMLQNLILCFNFLHLLHSSFTLHSHISGLQILLYIL